MGAVSFVVIGVAVGVGAAGPGVPPGESNVRASLLDVGAGGQVLAPEIIPTWRRTLGGSLADELHAVRQTVGGNYIVAGEEGSWGAGGVDGWVVKLDFSGARSWSATFGGAGQDHFRSVDQTSDGGYVVAGYEGSWGNGGYDGWMMKLDSSGN